MVEEERETASARVRVASVHIEPGELRIREIEQAALASTALDEFLIAQAGDLAAPPQALPDYTANRVIDDPQPVRSGRKIN